MKQSALPYVIIPFALACTVGPDYKKPAPDMGASYHAAGRGVSSRPADLAAWWREFHDEDLNQLVERAFDNNFDLRIAEQRIRESRALRGVAAAAWYPKVDANGSFTRQRISANGFFGQQGGGGAGGGGFVGGGSGANRTIDLWAATADASWELDIFGGTRREVEAAGADIEAQVEQRREVFVTLLGEIGRAYVDLRGQQRQLEILNSRIQSQQKTVDLTRIRYETGLSAELDLVRAQAILDQTRSELPTAESAVRVASHRIAVLLGGRPESLQSALLVTKPIPQPPGDIPTGAPAELLLRRPDIRRAERECAAASARIGAAVAAKYPKFRIATSIGPQATELRDLLDNKSIFYSLGPQISIPLFQGGRLDANIEVQTAREQQALLKYQQTLLTALEEVENGIIQYTYEQSRIESLGAAVASRRRAHALAQSLFEQGIVDFLNVLDAERELLQSESELARSATLVTQNAIFIYKSLGGGWQNAAPAGS